MRFRTLSAVVAALMVSAVAVAGTTKAVLDEAMERARKMQSAIKVPEPSAPARAIAQDAADIMKSEGMQKRIEEYRKELRQTFGLAQDKETDKTEPAGAGILKDERLLVFISSSMPMTTLRNYATDLEALGDPRVMFLLRGFVGGMKKLMPTVEFIKRVLVKEPLCDWDADHCEMREVAVNIDPEAYRRCAIGMVPAIVLEYGKGKHVLVIGDVPLSYALKEMVKVLTGPTKSRVEGLVKKLEGM